MARRVREAFSYDDEHGVPVTMRLGTLVEDNDPRVLGHEQFFEDAETAAGRTAVSAVEVATAAPGERRSVRRSAKSDN